MSAAVAQALAGVVAESRAMKEVVALVLRLADTRSPVLLEGESGTGKDLVAYWLHYAGARREGPFIKVHCPSIPGELLESELFGHEKGAFTDARQAKAGKLEMAAAGTLYFDQIQDLAPALQAKLLRVIEERRFERVGGTRTLEVDVRFVASANVDLGEAVRAGRFREDLFHRLNVMPLKLDPLRARREDVEPLALAFLARERERGTTGALGFLPRNRRAAARLPLAGQRARAALARRARGALGARGRDRAPGAAAAGAGAAVGALGRPRAPPVAQGRRSRLHPLRARSHRAKPDARGGRARHLKKGALGETAPLRDRLGERRTMDQKKVKSYRDRLLLKKQEILEAYNKNKSYGKEADGEATQDIADKAANSYTKEFLFSLSNSERNTLQQVDDALTRIETRRYGVCAACEDDMNLKRLEAVPWARLCLSCQEKQESGQL